MQKNKMKLFIDGLIIVSHQYSKKSLFAYFYVSSGLHLESIVVGNLIYFECYFDAFDLILIWLKIFEFIDKKYAHPLKAYLSLIPSSCLHGAIG